MLTAKQIAAQLKKERLQLKRDLTGRVHASVMRLLTDSSMFQSSLWPKYGFKSGGYSGVEKLDTITIGIRIDTDGVSEYRKVRFNLWGKPSRVLKQRRLMVLIFDQAISDGIYFYPEYPDYVNELSYHYHGNFIMDMLDFKFKID